MGNFKLVLKTLETYSDFYVIALGYLYNCCFVLFWFFSFRFIVGKEEIPTHSFSPETVFSKIDRKIKHCEKISQPMNILALTKKLMDKV